MEPRRGPYPLSLSIRNAAVPRPTRPKKTATLFVALTGCGIETRVVQELIGAPGWPATAEVLLEPFEVRGVIERHFVPARPVARVRINDELRGNMHPLQGSEELQGLRVGDTIVALTRNDQAGRLEVLHGV